MGKPNLPGFKDHRHDQAILAMLAIKYGLHTFRDPSQWGNHAITTRWHESPYPQLFDLTRDKSN